MDLDPDGSILSYVIALLVLIATSTFFSMSEAAIINLNDGKVKRMADEGNKRAKLIVKLTSSPARFLATIQTGITISGLLAVAVVAERFAQLAMGLLAGGQMTGFERPGFVVLITLLLSYFILIFGNLLPKRLAAYFPEQIAFAVAPALHVASILLRPVVALLSASTNFFLRLMGQNPNADLDAVTEEEIRMMVDVGEENGAIEQSEKDMINNIFEFDDRTVEELMTHRMEVVAVSETATLEEIVEAAKTSGYSRIPVYSQDMDNIVGILYAKDLLDLIGCPEAFDIHNFLREPFYVPESIRCTELFKHFKAKKLHMAVVIDEYGGTYGIVTMEDLLESIVGNIQDEYDNEKADYEKVSEQVYIFDGWTSVDDVEHLLEIEIPDDVEYETLGGVITDMLGDIPKEDEHPSVVIGNVIFTVLEVEDRRITRIRAEITVPSEDGE